MVDLVTLALQVFLGLLVENAGEWLFHRYVLHRLGKRPHSVWNFHWSEHHRTARANHMLDPGYEALPVHWNSQGKEAALLSLIVVGHLPVMAFWPWYVCGLYAGLTLYYLRHRRSHLDPEWAVSHLPWHYEHHLSMGAEGNWCITWPWFDWLMRTRVRAERIDVRQDGLNEKSNVRP